MNHWSSSEAQPVVLSRLLAELVKRLRLSHVENLHHEPIWPICSRLGVQADLLGGLARESGLEAMSAFTQSLTELAVLGRDDPSLIPQSWSGTLERLAEFLDQMMTGLDQGDAPARWLADPQWERLTNWFINLDTPYTVMDELEEILLSWQNSWCDGKLESKDEKELHERWLQLCKFGDALFCSSNEEPGTSLLRWKGFSP